MSFEFWAQEPGGSQTEETLRLIWMGRAWVWKNKENKETGMLPPAPSAGSVALTKSTSTEHMSYLAGAGAPRDLKGVFVRRFRWGTVDVLDPKHCDFAALRTAIFSTHMKVLKTHTKEVLYEKYRTEKLLARRATRNISEEERKRLLEGPYPFFCGLPSLTASSLHMTDLGL